MSLDYTTFLAATILNDGAIVTYRSLSRSVGVHSNVAKRMLFNFYQGQTTKKHGSIHATYLISGTVNEKGLDEPGNISHRNGEDATMQSSPFMSSSQPCQNEPERHNIVRTVSLVREEDLQDVKALYSNISTTHIYSLEPGTLQNLQVLSSTTQNVFTEFANDDPLQLGKRHGVIQNHQVKRRSGVRPVAATFASKSVPEETPAAAKRLSKAIAPEQGSKNSLSASFTTGGVDPQGGQPNLISSKTAGKVPFVKKEQSDIFKSFSKPKPRLVREDTNGSTGPSPAITSKLPEEGASARMDEPMKSASEDEQEEDFLDTGKVGGESNREAKAKREEQNRRMMEDDDNSVRSEPEVMLQDSQESKDIADSTPRDEGSGEPGVAIHGGRRRGRRKVMKKKMLKDDEGYLVTKEEPVWESFSEDEPAPTKAKLVAQFTTTVGGKGKKAGGKSGQGNITSFFGKR